MKMVTSEVKSLRSEVNEMRQSRREDLKTMKTLLEKVHQTVCASSKAGRKSGGGAQIISSRLPTCE